MTLRLVFSWLTLSPTGAEQAVDFLTGSRQCSDGRHILVFVSTGFQVSSSQTDWVRMEIAQVRIDKLLCENYPGMNSHCHGKFLCATKGDLVAKDQTTTKGNCECWLLFGK